jgi:hypothetical protein
LETDGFSADDDEYYEEVRGRLKQEFPQKFGKSTSGRQQSVQTLGGASRGSAPNRVRLSASEASLAKRMGLTVEQYAAEKRRVDASTGGYTVIE